MKKPKLLIIVLFQNLIDEKPYYALSPAPPLPGILLAALTPPIVEIEVVHEMVRPINYNTDADFVAISFMDYLAPHAFEVASRFKALGKTVIGGGKYATTFPEKVIDHFDSILIGEAQTVWPKMVYDMVNGNLKNRYDADTSGSLENIPAPRYDLVEKKFSVPIVTETSRGCTHSCTYCQLNIKPTPYRIRPVKDVINDLKNTKGLSLYKRKMAMILDNNFGGNLAYAKELLREISKMNFWAIGIQFSIECLRDDEFVELLSEANCRMAFIGMESLNSSSLNSVKKTQNKVYEYKPIFQKLNRKGILSFVGLMFALEEDTSEYYKHLPERLDEVGVSVVLSSISIPIYGTPLYHKYEEENRITDYDISHYEGDHVVFKHNHLTQEEIYSAYKKVNRRFYSPLKILKRWVKIIVEQSVNESHWKFIFKLFVLSFIYFKLSVFQWHHAKKRVFKKSGFSKSITGNINHQLLEFDKTLPKAV